MNKKWSRRAILGGACAAAGVSAFGLFASGQIARSEDSARNPEIRFRDFTGEEIILPRPAERIVDLWTVGTAFVIAAHGSPDRMIAVNDRAHAIFKRGLIGRFYPEVLDIPYDVLVGNGAPNVERLVNLNPDLVVDFKHSARDTSVVMKNAGLRVARYTELEEGTRATIAALLRMYGQMIGDTGRAERIIAIMEETTARLSVVQAIPKAARPSVLNLMPLGGRFHASGGGPLGIYSDFIYSAGGVNAAATLPGLSVVSVEQIATWDPDVILIFQSEGADTALIYDHPILGSGKAAVGRRVYVLPIGANNWGSMGPDEFLSHVWLAELLHPDVLESTLRRDMRLVYSAIFNRTLSDSELDDVLRNDINGSSAGYARFRRET
jgi:iron complex transport system substrate-binding protein